MIIPNMIMRRVQLIADLIPECAGALHLANKWKRTQIPEVAAAAEEIIRNLYNSAVEERERWIDAREKVEQLIEVLGLNPQFTALRDQMNVTAGCWDDCAREYSKFLESLRS